MKLWLVGKPGLEKYIDGIYERIEQTDGVVKDENELFSIELNLANSLMRVREAKWSSSEPVVEKSTSPVKSVEFTSSTNAPKVEFTSDISESFPVVKSTKTKKTKTSKNK